MAKRHSKASRRSNAQRVRRERAMRSRSRG